MHGVGFWLIEVFLLTSLEVLNVAFILLSAVGDIGCIISSERSNEEAINVLC